MPQICTYGWSRRLLRIVRPRGADLRKPRVVRAMVTPPPAASMAKASPPRRPLIDISKAPSAMEQAVEAWRRNGQK